MMSLKDNWEKESRITEMVNDLKDSLDRLSDDDDESVLNSPGLIFPKKSKQAHSKIKLSSHNSPKKNESMLTSPMKVIKEDQDEEAKDTKDTDDGRPKKEIPKLNFEKVVEKYKAPSFNMEGVYKYEGPVAQIESKQYEIDNFKKRELLKSDNYEILKLEVKKTRKAIKEIRSKNRKNKDHYLKLVTQINSIKDSIMKTDNKIIKIEQEFRKLEGITPDQQSTPTISELVIFLVKNSRIQE